MKKETNPNSKDFNPCTFENNEYSHGSEICSAGKVLRCHDGVWEDIGEECESENESLEFIIQNPKRPYTKSQSNPDDKSLSCKGNACRYLIVEDITTADDFFSPRIMVAANISAKTIMVTVRRDNCEKVINTKIPSGELAVIDYNHVIGRCLPIEAKFVD